MFRRTGYDAEEMSPLDDARFRLRVELGRIRARAGDSYSGDSAIGATTAPAFVYLVFLESGLLAVLRI